MINLSAFTVRKLFFILRSDINLPIFYVLLLLLLYVFGVIEVVSSSLWLHGLQHARLPCPLLSPGVYSNLCLLSQWCYLTISSSAAPFSFSLQFFPAPGSFINESVLCIRWPKYWSFSFSINPCSEYSGLISFRMAWFDLLAVQGTLKSLLQHHSSKASILSAQ